MGLVRHCFFIINFFSFFFSFLPGVADETKKGAIKLGAEKFMTGVSERKSEHVREMVERERGRGIDRKIKRGRGRQKKKREGERHREKEGERGREKERGRQREKEGERDRYKEGEEGRERERERDRERETEGQCDVLFKNCSCVVH